MNLNLKSLIGKLNETSRKALEAGAGLCVTRTHYDIDIEHLLIKLIESDNTDVQKILRHYEVDQAKLTRDLTRALDRLKTGNARTPAFSPRIPRLIAEAWNLASIDFGAQRVRSGHLLLAILGEENLARLAREASPELQKVSVEELHKHFPDLTTGTAEDEITSAATPGEDDGPTTRGPSKTPSLDQFTIDLTERARKGQIDPVLGRDFEIRQMVDILTRRRQNNPILTGEAGVGKTAVVEGLALRIAQGDVPQPLRNVALKSLDLTLLQAGAGVKGEFENRLKSVIEEVKASPQPIILFIDEAHTMIGAGGQAGQGDAANILKPALARGELRTIAATTWSEYKKYFEKDAALTRRFQVVKVDEPTEEEAVAMLRGLMSTLESHHNVRVLDEAMDAAVRLSHRYITGRQLPDKAVSVLDTSCARVALGQMTTPAAIEDCQRRITLIDTELGILERESLVGGNYDERIQLLAKEKTDAEARLDELTKKWEQEKTRVEELRGLREKLEAHALAAKKGAEPKGDGQLTADEVKKLQGDIARLNEELAKIQGESPLMQVCVDSQAVAEVVSGWTGIPVGKVLKDEIQTVLALRERLEERIIGQSHALEAISQRIRTARAKLEDPRRPIGVFMLVGPSGVGKTETALALADTLFGGERNVVVINMSEYQEGHTVSGLKGSPPGYVGYGEGGVLTEAVRRKPYSVVLLDEMEKAHTDVMELFYQVFDKGMLEDGEGREIDFKNTLILMTSNAGTDTIAKLCADPDTKPEPEALAEALRPDLLKVFKPAFLGRAIIVPYYPIADDIMKRIIELQLGRIQKRLFENHRAQFSYDAALVDEVARRCTEVESGARNVDHILTRTLLPEISREFLARMASGEAIGKVHVSVGDQGKFRYEIA
ncbi:MAG TPA: type VI secretion system ATPase TssH [Candidatus Binatia bacterium]|nr:type VI secretion system ATPase TssH [Candidatus Binatia bacterium]